MPPEADPTPRTQNAGQAEAVMQAVQDARAVGLECRDEGYVTRVERERDEARGEVERLCEAAALLAREIARCATGAPAGTRWPTFRLGREHPAYAIAALDGSRVVAGGEDPAQARRALATELLRLALDDDHSALASAAEGDTTHA